MSQLCVIQTMDAISAYTFSTTNYWLKNMLFSFKSIK